jgi:hypothetical protein
MAISAAICNSYKVEIFQGIHLAADTYMIALFTSAATLGKSTTVYSSTNEVANGGGYATGGIALVGFTAALDTDTAYVDFSTDPSWANATITARGALIYNASRSNKAVAVLDFGADKTSTNGTFLVTLPAPAAATALIRIA